MVPRIVIFVAIAAVLYVVVTGFDQGAMTSTVQNVSSSVLMIAYTHELDQIPKVVDEFMVLREIKNTQDGRELAAKLDEKINNLGLVKAYCSERISTMELAYENDPYKKLQQLCHSLQNVSFAKAVELFSLI